MCGEFWYSSSILFSKALQAAEHREKKELYDAIYQREKQRAQQAAGQEARERFSQCPICRRLVCDACFLICDEMDLCRECAGRMEEAGEPVFDTPQQSEFYQHVMGLPPKYRAAVYLYYYEDCSVQEIAAAMGANPSTVQTWLMRARGLLREALQEA